MEWNKIRLESLPNEESESYEYKSSLIIAGNFSRLSNEISIAASAFWNSGGGIFIAGVNDNGKVDGGITNSVGRQKLRDWVDNAIGKTQPLGEYRVYDIPINEQDPNSKVVLVIEFIQSFNVPHMAFDNKYYIRAGARSVSANHFLVESLRALKQFARPQLKAIMTFDKRRPNIECLKIISINDSPAVDVSISFNPFPAYIEKYFPNYFPIKVAVIDKSNPYELDVSVFGARNEAFGENPVNIIMSYNDVLGNTYRLEQEIHPERNLPPSIIGEDIFVTLNKSIKALTTAIGNLKT